MEGYGFESRASPPISIRCYTRNLDSGVEANVVSSLRSFSSKKETVMSFRSSQRGQLVPDYIADPYAHFLKMGVADKISLKSKEQVIPDPKRKEILTGVNPSKKKYLPPVDNGHSFFKTEQKVWTSKPKDDYLLSYRTTGRYVAGKYVTTYIVTRGGPLHASRAEINILNSPRMLFTYPGAYSRRVGLVTTDSTQNMTKFGQKAIEKTSPNRPDISLAAILGELREGLPSLIGLSAIKLRAQTIRRGGNSRENSKRAIVKAGSDEYINLQFGVLPLIADLQAVFKALLSVTDRLRQYEVDAGNGVRRRMSLNTVDEIAVFNPNTLSSQGQVSVDGTAAPEKVGAWTSSDGLSGSISSLVTQQLIEKVWFTGSFTYYVPIGRNLSTNIDKYVTMGDKLFGMSPSIETLWQLSPWSWFADWLLDIGSTISAYERIQDENLVINYGYVMATSHKKTTQLSTVTAPFTVAGMRQESEVMTTFSSVRKERVRANPYGFSATSEGALNPKQMSILGALGVIKGIGTTK